MQKEINYAYKKEMEDHRVLPPKYSNNFGSKKSLNSGKNHEKRSSTSNLKRDSSQC